MSEGQRAVYEVAPGGRQYRGKVLAGLQENGRGYVDFQADSGEVFRGAASDRLTLCEDPEPKHASIRTILIRDRSFVGHKYRFDGGCVIRLIEKNVIEVYDDDGKLLKTAVMGTAGKGTTA